LHSARTVDEYATMNGPDVIDRETPKLGQEPKSGVVSVSAAVDPLIQAGH
jgi:hypothetical protein